jgi:hypothetical protein
VRERFAYPDAAEGSIQTHFYYTVGYATSKDATKNECYNEIKSGCYNEYKCYKELGGIISAEIARACARIFGVSRFD